MRVAILSLLVVCVGAAPVGAQPWEISGLKAQHVARALKLAGVKPQASKGKAGKAWTYRVGKIECNTLNKTKDGLAATSCTLGKRSVKGAQAAIVHDALDGIVAFAKPSTTDEAPERYTLRVPRLTCVTSPDTASCTVE